MPTDEDETIYMAAIVTPTGEKYFFFYSTPYRQELLRCLGRFAATPDLSLSWTQAAALTKQCEEQWKETDGR